MNNMHEKILEFLMTYKPLAQWYFNINRAEHDTINVIPITGEVYIKSFIDGSGTCAYDFAVNIFKSFSTDPIAPGEDNQNISNFFDVQQFMYWIDEQDKIANYPDLDENISIQKLELLQNIPFLAGQDETVQKITFSARITYFKKRRDLKNANSRKNDR